MSDKPKDSRDPLADELDMWQGAGGASFLEFEGSLADNLTDPRASLKAGTPEVFTMGCSHGVHVYALSDHVCVCENRAATQRRAEWAELRARLSVLEAENATLRAKADRLERELNPTCGAEIEDEWPPHVCVRLRDHDGTHECGCRFSWPIVIASTVPTTYAPPHASMCR